ncbi:hypothetical protein [Christiangramia sp.]|uniref:hypothetical protein n=1 Tax=Christiangramia sp. TaxID=1931228 RepID=UPI00262B7F94|nr:hypothetical protein [Christiangramia sp.]
MSKDILLYENGTGGEMKIISGDLVLTEILFNQVYLAFFGGNLQANTKGNELPDQQRFDYWANSLLFNGQPAKQFNSNLERALGETVYNSSGRIEIENAAKKDLEVLNGIVNTDVEVFILSESRLKVTVYLSGLNNNEQGELQFIWNNAKQEIVIEEQI